MQVVGLEIAGVLLIRPRRLGDDRGFFCETFRKDALAEAGVVEDFVQDNLSLSRQVGTVRGLHFQAPPHAQAKLVSVVTGSILDIAVDARRGSPTFGRHVAARLGAEDGAQIYVPAGFLHGFITLEPDTRVSYKVSDYYAAACDGTVRWNDPALGIDWGPAARAPRLSARDAAAPLFADFASPFAFEAAA